MRYIYIPDGLRTLLGGSVTGANEISSARDIATMQFPERGRGQTGPERMRLSADSSSRFFRESFRDHGLFAEDPERSRVRRWPITRVNSCLRERKCLIVEIRIFTEDDS